MISRARVHARARKQAADQGQPDFFDPKPFATCWT